MTSGIPKSNERQKLLYDRKHPTDPKKLSQLGHLCLEKEILQDALFYFQGAKDREGLELIRKRAEKEGDSFLFLALEPDLGPFSKDQWNDIGQTALDKEKPRFAKMAFEKAENEKMLEKLAS